MRMRVHDGAYGTLLASRLRPGETADDLSVRDPQAVIDVHRAYLDAGAQAVQSNTFLAHMRESSRRRRRIVEASLACAREALDRSGSVAQLFGTIGPAGAEARGWWSQMEQLLEAGVDGVLCETITDVSTALACAAAWHDVAAGVTDTPLLLGCCVSPSRGVAASAWVEQLVEQVPGTIEVGLSCCEGPAGLRPLLEQLCAQRGSAWIMPSAGLPTVDADGTTRWPLAGSESWSAAVAELVEGLPVERVGGCCGTTPSHVSALCSLLA